MAPKDNTYEKLRNLAISMGASLFGVADLDRVRSDTDLLDSCYDKYSRGLSVGVRLNVDALSDVVDGPTQTYVREYRRVNHILDATAEALEKELCAMGVDAVRIPASKVVDWEKLRGHLPHKLIARYAGLGWIGRNILLVNSDFGARVRYVTVLTDAAIPPDSPTDEDCDECYRCVAVCPAGAAAKDPADFDLQACFSKLVEFNERLDEPHYICGLCVKACRGKTRGG